MSERESVFFYTFHKCASSLFAGFVLPRVDGLTSVNYAAQIFRGEIDERNARERIMFHPSGQVYGPLRLSANPTSRVRALLIDHCATEDFVRERIAVFLVRDPRDILVSAYYSFGFTHPWSPDPAIRAQQEIRRAAISAQTIDEYASANAPLLAQQFALAVRLRHACSRSVLLRYEDMIHDWPVFEAALQRHLRLAPSALMEMRARITPRQTEDTSAHQRSGATGSHARKLTPETVQVLDGIFEGALSDLGYPCGVKA
jgi:hypothetical protein